jgi:hypothetical protein
MKGHVALVDKHSPRFAVVQVSPSLMSGLRKERDEAARALTAELGVPAVLMIQDSRGTPTYHGPADLIESLADVRAEGLSWREFTIRAG